MAYPLIAAGVVLLALLAAAAYGNLRRHPRSRTIPLAGQSFPRGFLWATGEDAYQHEGGNFNNDWAAWEAVDPSPITNGDRCGIAADFYERYASDFRRAKKDGQNAHRIGVEWSRLEPREGEYDERAWKRYEAMLRALKREGFTVFLNLWHFTLPLWAARKGGWENPGLMARWEELVARCAARFGPMVDYWSTMIDAQIYALAGYATGELPPNRKDQAAAIRVYRTLIHAHARAYHLIKKHADAKGHGPRGGPPVGMIYFFFHFEPKSFFIDRVVCRQMESLFNWNMLDALHTGTIDIRVLLGPKVRESDPLLKGTLDWLGVNYYTRQIISFNPLKPGFIDRADYADYPASDMKWEIYPEGLYRLCGEIGARYRGVPVMITECGIADAADTKRPRFIADHLAWAHRLAGDGFPLIGFTYWSQTDNWEWKEGFWPKFGLYRVDRQTMERRETRSARLYRFIAQRNRLPDEGEFGQLL